MLQKAKRGRNKGSYKFSDDLTLNGYQVADSGNVEFFAWTSRGLFVQFKGANWYLYEGVSRQRTTAMSRALSVGQYLNAHIKPNYKVTKLVWPEK